MSSRSLRNLSRGGVSPEFIRSDNGPEFVAKAIKEWIARKRFETSIIKLGSPRQNANSESSNSRFRDEFLNIEPFTSLTEAKVLGEEHRYKYSHQRPHSSLVDRTPRRIRKSLCVSAAAYGLRSEAQRREPQTPTETFIELGSKNGALRE